MTTPENVRATIDGIEIEVPPGTLVIRAAEQLGIAIPRFCDHPLLAPAGACRQCLVEVEGQRKPLASCTTTVTDGMNVRTQATSAAAAGAQRSVMELLLVNHPLDCPVCDKGGECPLQNQAMSAGRATSRFPSADKRTYPKPIPLSAEIVLDRERCVLCARCTRFSDEIAGDDFIELMDRGALQQVGVAGDQPLDSYFSGNTVQICPVGALTNTSYRFRARPFDLTSTPSACEHCASGCALRVDHRRGEVLRRLAGDDPEVNEEWNCDKGRWAFTYATQPDRLSTPLIRDADGRLVPASWPEAVAAAARGLTGRAAGVLAGGRGTVEDLYAYSAFARIALHTNDIDFRIRPHSTEEASFLGSGAIDELTYADLDTAPVVLLAGFEPEEESPIVHLRLRKAVRAGRTRVLSVAPFASRGLTRLRGELIACVPGGESGALADPALPERLSPPGSVILVGERLAEAPGALAAAAALAASSGARLAWIPRRAGEPGAVASGALAGMLPGGRLTTNHTHRTDVEAHWGVTLPDGPGRDTTGILAAAAAGELPALVCGAVDIVDLPDPQAARRALDTAFVVSLEQRESEVTARADVVLPVATVAQRAGTFRTWEGRERPFGAALPTPGALADARVLAVLAQAMRADLGFTDTDGAAAALRALGSVRQPRRPVAGRAGTVAAPGDGEAVLATWRQLLDLGRGQDGEPDLAATARPPVARMSAATATGILAANGTAVSLSTARGAITLPLEITDMPDHVVWVPRNSPGSTVAETLGVGWGAVVGIGVAR
ncbi:NADH-quinone oxidoreductase subunit G [Tsukamurella pulmonis]|uniref:NADH-quinone oxidoreductase subunit G n=2 Tax=Tsukamurella pulmonis TaxID=47312 RepID=UPI000791A81B|nr:NADH-quinone oxidoreductase subunit G [Tsukamurella pulmonis]KXP11086.1 NADH-quinone oxidoreductase subunit G [Tsukamurella pulmonis]